jgi:enoyl-CoA hydratase/carnithine racemase
LTAREAMLTGRRYSAEEAKAAGIVHEFAPEADVLNTALAIATKHGGKPAHTLGAIKSESFRHVIEIKS